MGCGFGAKVPRVSIEIWSLADEITCDGWHAANANAAPTRVVIVFGIPISRLSVPTFVEVNMGLSVAPRSVNTVSEYCLTSLI